MRSFVAPPRALPVLFSFLRYLLRGAPMSDISSLLFQFLNSFALEWIYGK